MGTPTPRIPSVACTEFTNAILTEFIGDSGFVLFEWCILVIAINIELVSCYDSVFWIIPFFFFCELEGFLKFVLYSHGAWNTAKKVSLQWRYLVVFITVGKESIYPEYFDCVFCPFFLMLWLVNLFLIGLCLLFIWHLCICSWYAEFLKQKNPKSEGFHTFKKPDRFKSNCIISQQFHSLGDFACLVSFQKSA